ncbi:MAG: protein kinase [Alphaproteobacteria bacterium]|nr:protein kinase [Alphaproteobacteria bacterium]
MELVEGVTLERLIGVHRLTVPQIDATAAALFDGIEAAHQLGLVHRDLKPENVMMQITPSGLVPRIMDFGLAKAADAMRVGRATRPAPSWAPHSSWPPSSTGTPPPSTAAQTSTASAPSSTSWCRAGPPSRAATCPQ